jgi:hypothetical protein
VDAIGADVESQVGAVVEDEGDAVVPAHFEGQAGPLQQGPGVETLVPQLDHIHPAADTGGEEGGQVGPIGRAQVQPAVAQPPSLWRT